MATVYLLTKVGEQLENLQRKHLEKSLKKSYGDKWRDIGNGSYLISVPSTDVTGKAGVRGGKAGAYVMSPVKPYFGWANGSIWEWIEAND